MLALLDTAAVAAGLAGLVIERLLGLPTAALAGPAGARPGFLLFVFGVSCPFDPPSASFRRTLRSCSRAINARFRSGNAPPGPRQKYLSSPRSHTGRVAPAARPVGCLVLGPVFKYLLD